jgi:hypothetical protein
MRQYVVPMEKPTTAKLDLDFVMCIINDNLPLRVVDKNTSYSLFLRNMGYNTMARNTLKVRNFAAGLFT